MESAARSARPAAAARTVAGRAARGRRGRRRAAAVMRRLRRRARDSRRRAGAGDARGPGQHLGRPRMGTGRGDVADLELERLEAAEHPAGEAGHDVDPVALATGPRRGRGGRTRCRRARRRSRRSTSWVWPPLAARTRGHGQAEDGDERLRVPGAARREPREVAVEAVVDEPTPAARGRRRAGVARPRAPRTPPQREEPVREGRPSGRPGARSRPRRRGRRGAAAGRRTPRGPARG